MEGRGVLDGRRGQDAHGAGRDRGTRAGRRCNSEPLYLHYRAGLKVDSRLREIFMQVESKSGKKQQE